MTREALLAEVMRLPVEERRALALEVLDSSATNATSEAMQPDIEASHRAELDRRLELSDAGSVQYSPWDEIKARIFGHDD